MSVIQQRHRITDRSAKGLVAIVLVAAGLLAGCNCHGTADELMGTALVDPVRRSAIPPAQPEGGTATVLGTSSSTKVAER